MIRLVSCNFIETLQETFREAEPGAVLLQVVGVNGRHPLTQIHGHLFGNFCWNLWLVTLIHPMFHGISVIGILSSLPWLTVDLLTKKIKNLGNTLPNSPTHSKSKDSLSSWPKSLAAGVPYQAAAQCRETKLGPPAVWPRPGSRRHRWRNSLRGRRTHEYLGHFWSGRIAERCPSSGLCGHWCWIHRLHASSVSCAWGADPTRTHPLLLSHTFCRVWGCAGARVQRLWLAARPRAEDFGQWWACQGGRKADSFGVEWDVDHRGFWVYVQIF